MRPKLSQYESSNKKIFWVVTSVAALLAVILPTLDDSLNRSADTNSFRGPTSVKNVSLVKSSHQNKLVYLGTGYYKTPTPMLNNRTPQEPEPDFNNDFINVNSSHDR